MITLSALILVFLLGHWVGFRAAQAQTRKDTTPILAALDELQGLVLGRWACPSCGVVKSADTFNMPKFSGPDGLLMEDVRVCSTCLHEVRVQR